MRDAKEEFQRLDLRIRIELIDPADPAAGKLALQQKRFPIGSTSRSEPDLDELVQLLAVRDAIRVRAKPRIERQVGQGENVAEALEELIVRRRDERSSSFVANAS